MWLVCGLGNPGNKFQNTRHNVGFDIFDLIITKYNFELKKKDTTKELFKGTIAGSSCLFCKPLTYMNLSGPVIRDVSNFYKISKSKIIIIHDDLDVVVGGVKIKIGGGNGGHNGLLSIDEAIGNEYKRLRIGISHPGSKDLVSSYVLEKFNKDEKQTIDKIIQYLSANFELIFNDDALLLTKIASEINKNNGL